jgi:hypothetical protein
MLVIMTGAAQADEYLEDEYPRDGFMIGVSLGPGVFAGKDDLLGAGGSFGLRVGTSAGERFLWQLKLDSVGYLAEKPLTLEKVTNFHTVFSLGGQYYLLPVAWLEAGIGTASQAEEDPSGMRKQLSSGLGLMAGGGYDIFRRGLLALDIGATFGLGVYDDGAIAQFSVRLGGTYY